MLFYSKLFNRSLQVSDKLNNRSPQVSETEERKNAQIDNVKKKNERAVTEMKNYYNDITLNNLAMISTLKEEIKVLFSTLLHITAHLTVQKCSKLLLCSERL